MPAPRAATRPLCASPTSARRPGCGSEPRQEIAFDSPYRASLLAFCELLCTILLAGPRALEGQSLGNQSVTDLLLGAGNRQSLTLSG